MGKETTCECLARKALLFFQCHPSLWWCCCVNDSTPQVVCTSCVMRNKVEAALYDPCPCEELRAEMATREQEVADSLASAGGALGGLLAERADLRAKLAAFEDPKFKQLTKDLEERVDENRQLRAELAAEREACAAVVDAKVESLKAGAMLHGSGWIGGSVFAHNAVISELRDVAAKIRSRKQR